MSAGLEGEHWKRDKSLVNIRERLGLSGGEAQNHQGVTMK
jgi:hypothetical protein